MNRWERRPVVVTGAAGFLGRHLCNALVEARANVVAIDVKPSPNHEGWPQAVKWVQRDVREGLALPHDFEPEVLFHLAAHADVRKPSMWQNLDMTIGAIESCRPGTSVVLASSVAVWNTRAWVGEGDGPCLPSSMYGASKLSCEGWLSAYCEANDLRGLILRFGNIVGGRMEYGLLFDLLKGLQESDGKSLQVLGDGFNERPWLHVEDAVRALIELPVPEAGRADVVNVAGNVLTVHSVVDLVCEQLDVDPTVTYGGTPYGWPGDVRANRVLTQKARALGWTPRWSAVAAVKEAVQALHADGTIREFSLSHA